MKTALLFAPILLLAACSDPAETCSSYGFTPGTDAYANCQMQAQQAHSERMQRLSTGLNGMTMSGRAQQGNYAPPALRTPTRCIRYNYGFTCDCSGAGRLFLEGLISA